MLDLPSAPITGNPDRRRIELLAGELMDARMRGERGAIAERLAPDFVYFARGAWPTWPYHRGPIDRAQFIEAAGRTIAEVEFLRSRTHEFLVDGNAVAIHVTCASRDRGSGATFGLDFWLYLRTRDRLVVQAAIYADVAKAAKFLPDLIKVRSLGAGRAETWSESGSPSPSRRSPAMIRDGGEVRGMDAAPSVNADARYRAFVRRTFRDLVALRSKGDVAAILDRLTPDFVHNPLGDWTNAPLQPGPCDRAAFAEALRQVNVEFEDLGSEVHEQVVDGDRIAVHRTVRTRNRGSGANIEVDEWDHFRIRAGLVTELASYVDNSTAADLDWPAYGPPR